MSGDLGQRGSYGKPTHAASLCHNVLQIDRDELNSHSWVRNLSDMAGVQYLQAEAARPNSGILRRQVALVDVSEGKASGPAQTGAGCESFPQTHAFSTSSGRPAARCTLTASTDA